MNGALVHLLLNHIPILGSLFVICLIVYGLIVKSEDIFRAALVALVAISLLSIPAYLSGEDAEHVVEDITSVNKQAMEDHEDMAEISFWILMMNGAIALGTIIASRKPALISKPLLWINFIVALIVFVMMARTGWSGGQIRHSEIHIEKTVTGNDE